MKVHQTFLLIAVGLIACDKDINKESVAPKTVAHQVEVATEETKPDTLMTLVTEGGIDVDFIKAEALRPVSREELDQIWPMIPHGYKAKVLRVMGFVGDSSDLDRLIERAKDDVSDYSEFSVGIFTTRQDLDPDVAKKAFLFLVECSQPSWQQQIRGESASSREIYRHALRCVYGLALGRSSRAIEQLQKLSEIDHSHVMTSGDSKRFQVEALASVYRINRVKAYGGTIGYGLMRIREEDHQLKLAFAELWRAAEALGYGGEIMGEE